MDLWLGVAFPRQPQLPNPNRKTAYQNRYEEKSCTKSSVLTHPYAYLSVLLREEEALPEANRKKNLHVLDILHAL